MSTHPNGVPGVEPGAEIGRSPRSVVYRATVSGRPRADPSRPYAVKVLREAGTPAEAAEFRREAAMLATLRHPALAGIHEVGEAAGRPYLIMDLLVGRPLSAVVADGSLPPERVIELGVGIAGALAVAHRAGIVHRDVKPHNIMVEPDGRAVLIDFGLAVRSGGVATDTATGTFAYSAPEQTGMLRRPVDGRADLYALGAVLFECLTGAPPFHSDDVGQLIQLHMSAPPPDLRTLRPDVPAALAEVVAKLLAKDPDDRYGSGAEAAAALTAAGAAGDAATLTAAGGTVAAGSAGERSDDGVLIGCADLLAALTAHWSTAVDGHGGVVVVDGAPGAGKSRLAGGLADAVAVTGHRVLAGRCTADGGVPLAALREALTADPTAAARLTALAGTGDPRGYTDAVAGLLADVAGDGVLLVLDDVQWADTATRQVLRRLGPLLRTSRLLVLLTARADDGPDPGPDAGPGSVVDALVADLGPAVRHRTTLGPLDRAAVAQLIARELGADGDVPDELVTRLSAGSGGNPFAVLEYVRAVVDAGLVWPDWGSWALDADGLAELTLPADVMDLVLRRIDGLGGATRTPLTTAAVVGTRFPTELIAGVHGEQPAAETLAAAAARHLIEPTAGGYTFVHERIRAALLADLPEQDRRRLHQRVAEYLADTGTGTAYDVARHFLDGETDRTPERAYRAALAAGHAALAEHAACDAMDFLVRAADLGITPDPGFHATLGTAASLAGEFELARDHLTAALAAEPVPARRAALRARLVETYLLRWDNARAAEESRRALADAGWPLPRNLVLAGLLAVPTFLAGVLVGLLPARTRLARGARRDRLRLRGQVAQVAAYAAGMDLNPTLIGIIVLRSLYLAQRLGDGIEVGMVWRGLAVSARIAGLPGLADRLMTRAERFAVESGQPRMVSHMAWMRSVIHDVAPPMGPRTGAALRVAIEQHGRQMDVADYLTAAAMLGQTQAARGYADEVARLHRQCLAHGRAAGGAQATVSTLAVQAAALTGQPAAAAAELRAVRGYLKTMPANRALHADATIAAIQLAVESGETGAEFDRLAAEWAAHRLRPFDGWASRRAVYGYLAFGRLAQVAAASGSERVGRERQARRALRRLRRIANGPLMRGYHGVAAASLRQLRGEAAGALRRLARIEPLVAGLDAPSLGFETARVRARAYAALDRPSDARTQAGFALLLATEHGWAGRARQVRAEFGIEATATATAAPSYSTRAGTAYDVHHRRTAALEQVSLAAARVLDPAELARVTLDEIVRIFGAERAFLFLHGPDDEAGLTPFLGRESGGADLVELTGYGSSLVERVRHDGIPLVVTGSEEGAALGSRSAVVHGLRSIMVAPLTVNGRRIGVAYLDSRAAKGIFTSDDVDLLTALTNQVALALETARAAQLELGIQAARRERDTAQLLGGAMGRLTESLDPAEVAGRLCVTVEQAVPGAVAYLLHLAPDGELNLATAADGWTPVDPSADPLLAGLLAATEPVRAGAEPAAAAATRPVDPAAAAATRPVDPAAAGAPGVPLAGRLGPGVRDWLAVPLVARGVRRGLLLAATTGEPFGAAAVELVVALAGQGLAALDNARLFQQVQEAATRDALTGLFNRRHFFEVAGGRLAAHDRYRRPVAAIMLDIDHFKQVNDTHGHGVGDEVITTVGHRLAGALRDGDLLCRYGGEEFAVLLGEATAADAEVAAERLRQAVRTHPVDTEVGPLRVTVSVGAAVPAKPADELTDLLRVADEALYESKRAGRDRVTVSGE